MKKVVVVAAAVAGVLALSAGVGANSNAGELTASGFKCKIQDGTGHLFLATSSERWLYQTKLVLRCEGNGAPTTPPALTYIRGGPGTADCKVDGDGFQQGHYRTKNWVDKIGYNGNSQLTCTIPFPLPTDASADDPADDGIVDG